MITLKWKEQGQQFKRTYSDREIAEKRAALLISQGHVVVISGKAPTEAPVPAKQP